MNETDILKGYVKATCSIYREERDKVRDMKGDDSKRHLRNHDRSCWAGIRNLGKLSSSK